MITCVIPTKDEAHNLPHVLKTVRWCDEVLVIDMESTDGTPEMARALGATVIAVPNTPYFDSSRERGLIEARNEWVLSLDADEMVPVPLADRLRDIAGRGRYDVTLIPRLNFKFGRQVAAGLWPDYQKRFYKKGAVSFTAGLHDYLKYNTTRVGQIEADERSALHHFNYLSVSQLIEKLNRYTSADARKPAGQPRGDGRCLPLKRFVSLYVKHRGRSEGIPGLWWSGYMAFYALAEEEKRREVTRAGACSSGEADVARLNEASSLAASERVATGATCTDVRLATLLEKGLRGGRLGRRRHDFRWAFGLSLFQALAVEMKAWEAVSGRRLAEAAQANARMELSRQWEERAVMAGVTP
jgi:hypothetical protein